MDWVKPAQGRSVAGYCDHDNESSGSVTRGELLRIAE
jgi:hypothetical protein